MAIALGRVLHGNAESLLPPHTQVFANTHTHTQTPTRAHISISGHEQLS